MRRLMKWLPTDRLRWFGFHPSMTDAYGYRSVPPRPVHWRLSGTVIEQLWWNEYEAFRIATAIEREVRQFAPERLWVFPEMLATRVGLLLARRMDLPLHVTFHDAPETAGHGGMPWAYRARAAAFIRQLGQRCASADAVSPELVAHLRAHHWLSSACRTDVVVPAMDLPPPVVRKRQWSKGMTRRIALCGSFRGTCGQWQRLLGALGALPHEVEILCWTPTEGLPSGQPARNTRLLPQPYAEGDAALIDSFRAADVDVGYLSLDNSRRGACFARTSLSSKLVAYAAAGLPVLVDAPQDAVITRMITDYHAGVCLEGAAGVPGIHALLSDPILWQACAEGSATLYREHFMMEANVHRLIQLIAGHGP